MHDLGPGRHAAHKNGRVQIHALRKAVEIIVDLYCQFARGRDHQKAQFAVLGDRVDQRQKIGAGLARAGVGQPDHVAAFHGGQDCLVLDRRGLRKTEPLHIGGQGRNETEIGEFVGDRLRRGDIRRFRCLLYEARDVNILAVIAAAVAAFVKSETPAGIWAAKILFCPRGKTSITVHMKSLTFCEKEKESKQKAVN